MGRHKKNAGEPYEKGDAIMIWFIHGDVGLMIDDYKPDPESARTTVAFDGLIDGTLFIGKASYQVRMGKTTVPTAVLSEATNMSVTERITGKIATLEAPKGNPRDILRALAKYTEAQARKVEDLTKRVEQLEQYMLPKDNGLF